MVIDERAVSFNKNLATIILLIFVILAIRLFVAADSSDNWGGFMYSSIHLGIVGIGTYWALKR